MSDIAKGITDCLDTINKLRDENTAQADRIAELEAALRNLITPQTPAAFAASMQQARAALAGGKKDE